MLRAERQQAILELVKNRGIVAIEDLMAHTDSSKATIRRDINELAEHSLLVKIRGGARFATDIKLPDQEPSQAAKSLVNVEEKQRIAAAAKRHIHPNSRLFLDSGTTVLELARLLENEANLTFVTNDLQIGTALAGNRKSTLLFLGGMVRKGFTATYGYFAEQMLGELSVNQMFFSVDAVDPELNITSYTMEDINVKKIGMAQAEERILLCDHSKFTTCALFNICTIANIDTIIVPKELDSETIEHLRRSGITVEVV